MKTSNGKLNYGLSHLGTIPCQNGLYFDGYSLHWIIGDTYMQNHAQYTRVICTVSLLLPLLRLPILHSVHDFECNGWCIESNSTGRMHVCTR